MVVSDEIRSAIQFDHMTTVHEAIHAMKQYLDKAVMPLTLRQLEVIRYKPAQGTSQTQAVQTMLQMFRDADYWAITPEQLCKVFLLNTIMTDSMMVKVNEKLEETDDWSDVKDHIITVDRAEALAKNYLNQPRGRRHETGALVQGKKTQCLACGRRNHAMAECKIDKARLQCSYCKSKGSHMTKVCQKKARDKKKNPQILPQRIITRHHQSLNHLQGGRGTNLRSKIEILQRMEQTHLT